MANDTSLQLIGLSSGLVLGLSAVSGIVRLKTASSALTGYGMTTEVGSDKVPYTVVSLQKTKDPVDPPTLKLAAFYEQTVEFEELDLDLRFKNLPKGTEVEVKSSERALNISRRSVAGTGIEGAVGMNLGEFSSDIELNLWVSDPDALTSTSQIELTFTKIDSSAGGPVKKILLQKIVVKLGA